MNLTRSSIIAGVAALSLAASASPALAKGGGDGAGDINNTVVTFISPDAPAPFTGSSGGGGKRAKCTSVVDPVTGIGIGTCTTNRV